MKNSLFGKDITGLRLSARRMIASLLVAAECLSIAAVGAPAAWAESADSPAGQVELIEERQAAPQTPEAFEEGAGSVTPLEAAEMGAASAMEAALEAEQAALEAGQAALDAEQAEVRDVAAQAAARAEAARQRAAEAARRASEEAAWAEEAAQIAADEAGAALEQAQYLAEDAENAEQLYVFAEETAVMAEEQARILREQSEDGQNEAEDGSTLTEETSADGGSGRSTDRNANRDNKSGSTNSGSTNTEKTAGRTDGRKPENPNEAHAAAAKPDEALTEETAAKPGEALTEQAGQAEALREAAENAAQDAALARENAESLYTETEVRRADADQAAQEADRAAQDARSAAEAAKAAREASDRAAAAAERADIACERANAAVTAFERELTAHEAETAAQPSEDSAQELLPEDTQEAQGAAEAEPLLEIAQEAQTPEGMEPLTEDAHGTQSVDAAEREEPPTAEPPTTEPPTTEPPTTELRVEELPTTELRAAERADAAVAVEGEVPDGTAVVTRDVSGDFKDFDPSRYTLEQSEDEPRLRGNADSAAKDGRTTRTSLRVLAAYDITLTLDGEEYQPEPGSPLTVTISDPAIREGLDLQLWHIGDDGLGEQITDFTVEDGSIRFEAERFSAYVVVRVTLITHITAGDGNTYRVAVTYDQDADMPENAALQVRELDDTEKENYVNQSAEALETAAEDFAFARAFDISLLDPDTGAECQPASGVKVSISLLDTDLSEAEELKLLHFGDEVEPVDYTLNGNAVEFVADGFSVYVITGVHYLTFKFYVYNGNNGITWEQYGTEQRIKNGEKPLVPMPLSDDTPGLEFAGWYRYNDVEPGEPTGLRNWNDANVNWRVDEGEQTDEPYDFDNIPSFTSSGVVSLYAGYARFAHVIFHDQYDSETEQWPVAFTRRVELKAKRDPNTNEPVLDGEGNPVYEGKVRINDLETTYSGSENLACYGWSATPVETPGVYKNPSTGVPYAVSSDDGLYTVTGDTDLYPIYRVFHRLTFYTAQTGEDAEYVPTQTKFEDEGFGSSGKLPTTSRPGYTFVGWYIGTISKTTENGKTVEKVLYGSQVTDGTGSLTGTDSIPYLRTPVAGVSVVSGELRLASDTTLYAKWEKVPEAVEYQLVFWKQSKPGEASYVYYKTVPLLAGGTEVSFDASDPLPDGVDLTGYSYHHDDGPKTVSDAGATVLNIYYNLNDGFTPASTYTLTFADSLDGEPMMAPAAAAVAYDAPLSAYNTTPEDKKSDRGYVIYTFGGWYMDRACTIPANLDTMTMPACNLTVYAKWKAEWFLVRIDPNYGALYTQKADGSLEGTGSTWFWQTWESELIGEYTQATRDYVRSSGGDHYYVNRDRSFYGYSGTEWDNSEEHRETFYTSNPGENGASDETYEYAPGAYSYVGWYEVYPDGSEAAEPYDFSHHTDHHLTLRLRWKRSGEFYLAFNAGDGYLDSGKTIQKDAVSGLTKYYADQAGVVLNRPVFLPGTSDKVFIGWRLQNDTSGVVYPNGGIFTLHAEDAVREGGKDAVWLEAVYADSGTDKVTVVYDANGGTIGEPYDSGKLPAVGGVQTNAIGVKDGTGTTVTVQGQLNNNSEYILSDGTGFSWTLSDVNGGAQIAPAGWSNTRVYNPDDPASELYTCGGEYGVDINGGNITTVYAAWPVKVTYVLNNLDGSWNPAFASNGNYEQTRYIGWVNGAVAGSPVQEPTDIPTSTDDKMFYYWTEDASVQDPVPYDFSQPVTKDLTLYAVWDGPVQVPVHAVDASAAALSDKTSEWVADGTTISVGAAAVSLNGSAANTYTRNLPADYEYAFAAALDPSEALDREKVSEADAITAVYYNQAKKHLYVKYADTTRADAILEEGTDIYFFYYKEKALDIGYAGVDSRGVMTDKTLDAVAASAPNQTMLGSNALKLGEYDVTGTLTSPVEWVPGYSRYAYAIGDQNAANASQLRAITQTAISDSDRPALRVKNSWQGFLYSTDGGTTWKSCGYDPQLYVVYFSDKPTVIMLHEETLGTADKLMTEFSYHIVVTKVVNGVEDTANPVYDSEYVVDPNTRNVTQHNYVLTSGGVQSAVLFYSDDGSPATAQKITVTQTENTDFTTTVGTVETREWTCTSTAEGGTVDVTFTNRHKSLPVEVHVALLEGGAVVLKDEYRATDESNYRCDLALGESAAFLTSLPSNTVFTGDHTKYALGAIAYGTDDGSQVTVEEMGISSVSYGQVSGNHYELLLNGESAKELGVNKLYYLYYPAAHISYKKTGGTTLADVAGYQAENGEITYGGTPLEMNGVQVKQDQLLPIPVNGVLKINQSGSDSFRMPPYLDDSDYLQYLSYEWLGFGDSGKTDESEITRAADNTLYLRVGLTGLQYSTDGESWQAYTSANPTVYAVYRERGYDLMITKTVPAQKSELSSLFMGATFTVSIESTAITKDSYTAEGYESETIDATPASGTTPGSITLTVGDGTAIRILGLSQGSYTVTETQNENYDLTAKKGKIIGGTMSSIEVNNNAITFNLDSETKLAMTNSPHRLCRIVDNGLEHIFFTFADAIKYVEDNVSSLTATVEMLSNYTVPLADKLTVPYGYTITLDNAAPLYRYGEDVPVYFDAFSDAIDYLEQSGVLTGNNTARIYYLSDDLDLTKLQNAIPARYRAMIDLQKAPPVEPQSARTIIRSAELSAQPVIESLGRLTIRNLTLNGANIQATMALIQSAGDLNIGEGAIVQNAINSGNGGAVNATAGNVTVSGSAKIQNNQASGSGGAIYYAGGGTITVSDRAKIQNNQASGNGGAIYASSGTIAVSGSAKIQSNQASGSGGAIYGMSAVVSITGNAEVSGNSAQNGGAVRIETGAVTISDYVDPATKVRQSPKIQKNQATGTSDTTGNGGAVYVGSGTVTVNGGTLGGSSAGNTASNKGGAIYANSADVTLEIKTLATPEGEDPILSVVTIQNNQAADGGAIYAGSGKVTATGVSIAENKATSGDGGAICADSGNVTLSGVSMTKNTAATGSGGAIYADSGTVTVKENSVLGGDAAADGNTAQYGGAVCAQSGAVSISDSDVKYNTASENGGAIYAQNGNVTVTMTDGKSLESNSAKNGGAIFAGKGTVGVSGGAVKNNTASLNGGAVCTVSGGVTLNASAVTGNKSTGGHGGAVYSGTGSVNVTGCTAVTGNTAASGNGGVICTDKGNVTISTSTVNGTGDGNANTARNGGVVYTSSGAINVTGSTMNGNKATYVQPVNPSEDAEEPETTGRGGAICTVSGSVSISASTLGGSTANDGNSARNGGAVFAESGNITVSGESVVKYNTADVYGGAIYEGSGTVTIDGTANTNVEINIRKNTAQNGAAIFVDTGTGVLSGYSGNNNNGVTNIQENTATTENGGAVAVGSADARLFFSGNVKVKKNTKPKSSDDTNVQGNGPVEANVYLDRDTDTVINGSGLGSNSEIKIYVPGPFNDDLFQHRGAASALFGSYSSDRNLIKFFNDRNTGLTAQKADNNKIQWVSTLEVEVRYLSSLAGGFPPSVSGTMLFSLPKYIMPTSTNGASQIAEDIYANYETAQLKTRYPQAGFACVFKDGEASFDNYLTAVNWDGATGQWKFIQRGGTELTGVTKLIVYFADTSYLSIVNNTNDHLTLNISSLSVLDKDAADNGHYGYVTAKNGMTPDTMEPIAASDLTLAPGHSRKFLFPGAMGQNITLTGTFSGDSVLSSIQYIVDGDAEHPKTLSLVGETHSFELLNPDSDPANQPYTLRDAGETREFIFGEKALEICQVRAEGQENTPDANLPKFPSFEAAIKHITDTEAAQSTTNKKYSIEMLVDYLLPSSDKCELPGGYDITLTTAASYAGDRATISRDAGNMNDAIVKFINEKTTFVNNAITGALTIKNLIFDGRSLAGSGDGGAVTTMNACVLIDNCLFNGVEATNGGAIFVDFTASNTKNTPYQNQNENVKQATLTITNTEFLNCRSSSYKDKTGGGAIWTTARELTLDSCDFYGSSCYKDNPNGSNLGTAQAGAVFHNINDNLDNKGRTDVLGDKKPKSFSDNTKTHISNCTFTDCYTIQASAGAVESDALDVLIENCTFDTCYVKRTKNGGGLNIYANNEENPSIASYTTVRGCTFVNCSVPNNGGAFRTTSTYVTVENTTFTKCTGKYGGGFAAMGSKAVSLTVNGVTVDSCTALSNGYAGGIYSTAATVTIGDYIDGGKTQHTEVKNCTTPSNQGGGIYHNRGGSSFSMTNAIVTGNRTTGSTGGGIHTIAQNVTITGGQISNNTAKSQGGGLYVSPQNNAASKLEINGTVISGNTSTGSDGGGVWYDGKDDNVRAKMTLTLSGCTVDGNTANNGGGVYTQAKTVTVNDYNGEHASISNNTARNGSGGGIWHSRDVEGSTLTVTNAAIKGNESKTGSGGGVWTNARELTLTGAELSGNTTKNSGGGVYYDASEASRSLMALTVTGCTLDGNTASSYSGGGIYTCARTVTIRKNGETGTTISNCAAKNGGGGVYHSFAADPYKAAAEDASLTLNGSTISGCRATAGNGGGVYTNVRTLSVTDSTVSNCTSTANGGGVWYDSSSDDAAQRAAMALTLTNGTLSANTANAHGGGVYTGVDTVTVSNGEISNNTAGNGNGGGIHQQSSAAGSTLTVTGAEIKGNHVYGTGTNGKGGGVYAKAKTVTIQTGTEVSGNTASRNGGGICHDSAAMNRDLILDSAVVKENEVGGKGGGVYFAESTGAVLNNEGKAEPYAHLTMRHNAQVINNRLSGDAANAAGVYLPDYASLYVGYKPEPGEDYTTFDTITVKDNMTTAGHLSDLRLWSNADGQNNENSVYVYCGLTIRDESDTSKPYSEVRVVNANRAGTRFGISGINNPRGFVQGFSADKAVFKADDDSLFGIIDRSETVKIYIIWGGPAICKITDPVGTLLYLNLDNSGKGADPAVFDQLDTGDESDTSINSAFSLLRADTPQLYYADGTPYNDTAYCVKMLDSFTTQNRIIIPAGKTITFTTAGRNDALYPFEYSKTYKSKNDIATVTRGKNVGNCPLVNTETDLTLLNLTLDGGSLLTGEDKPEAGSYTSLLKVDSDTITVKLKGATLQNSETTGNGGGVYVNQGKLILGEDVQNGDAQIRNCKAVNGGGVYAADAASVEFRRGQIYGCVVNGGAHNGSGGGIYLANGTGKFTMTGGTISRCEATSNTDSGGSGGGIYAGTDRELTITGGKIQENHATHRGGGIAVDDKSTRLYFAKAPVISQNTCKDSAAPGQTCNVEMDKDTNAVIQTVSPGLYNGASIGVYVPGVDTGKQPDESGASQYDKHGDERKPFGTYDENGDMTTFYSFVNDRNGYKGGLMGTNDPEQRIYWVKIFSLEVAIRNSQDIPRNEVFDFQVTLSGKTEVADQKDAKDIHGYYGEMYFYSDGVDATRATVELELYNASENWVDGVNCIGENLSQDLHYVVTPQLTDTQKERYVLVPQSHTGTIGEFNAAGVTVDESERYISRAVFQVMPAVCKLTDTSGNLLYYYYEDEYRKPLNPNNDGCKTGVIHYLPAVFPDVNSAVEALNKAVIYAADPSKPKNALYQSNATPYTVTQGAKIQMLTDSKLTEAIDLPSIPITLTTASITATSTDPYRYYGSGSRATIKRAYNGDSMFTVYGHHNTLTTQGELVLTNIILDGDMSSYTAQGNKGNGGIALVKNGGTLKIETGAILQNSNSSAAGGAIYAESGAAVEMNAGIIRNNNTTGDGAGVCLKSGAIMKLSGNPNFTGNLAGTFSGSETNGPNYTYTRKRQDIYLVEADANPASLLVTGDLTGEAGPIWVWAEKSRHYEQNMPFAKLELPDGVTFVNPEEDTPNDTTKLNANHLKVFRNAQPDSATGNGTETWLFGTIREDTSDYVCWSGVEGSARVMLVKVLSDGTSYKALSGRKFTVYTKNGSVAKGTVYNDNGTTSEKVELSNLTSGAGGAFFIGELAYGEYYAEETGVSGKFEFTIDKGGVVSITDPNTNPKTTEPVKAVSLTTP